MLASAKNVYHNNFLEFKLTGNQKYKNAADSAMDSIHNVISDLEKKVESIPDEIEPKVERRRFIEEKDALVEAQLRTSPTTFSSVDWRYYVIIALAIVALVVRQ